MAVYNIVAVRRSPVQSAGPTLEELGPLEASFNYMDILNEAPEATFVLDTDSLQDDIKDALTDLKAKPLEVIIYRDSVGVFQGPIMSGNVVDTQLTLSCRGAEFYAAYMAVETDKTWAAIDEFTIFTDLIDDWQNQDYGDYGIDTVTVGTSGTTRNYEIPGATETRNVYTSLIDLAYEWGFDWYVDADTRELVLGARGSDLSSTVYLERGVQSANVQFGVAPGTMVSELYALGTAPSGDDPITATKTDTTVRTNFGRVGLAVTFDGADDATNLSDAADEYLADRGDAFFAPGPSILPITGAGIDDFNVGDTVTYTFDAGLGQVTGAWRVRKRRVTVETTGKETMQVEFI